MGTEFRWIEALCLASVILATTWAEISFNESEQLIDPVTDLEGYIQLSTRSSMDSLNLDRFQIGAKASFDLEVTTIEPEKCTNCVNELIGTRISGTVNITELIDDQGRSGRIEAEMLIDHIEERDSNGFLLQEWFIIDWDAGASSFNQIVHVVHAYPLWPVDNAKSSFLIDTDSGSASRNGPNLITEPITGSEDLVRACLPDSFNCNAVTNWDIEMNVKKGPIENSIFVGTLPENHEVLVPQDVDFSDSGLLGSWFKVTESNIQQSSFCLQEIGAINAAGSWNMEGSGSTVISPLSSIFSASGIPVLQLNIVPGNLTVLEGENGTCSHFIGNDSVSKISVFKD